jgi:hypothetical protein
MAVVGLCAMPRESADAPVEFALVLVVDGVRVSSLCVGAALTGDKRAAVRASVFHFICAAVDEMAAVLVCCRVGDAQLIGNLFEGGPMSYWNISYQWMWTVVAPGETGPAHDPLACATAAAASYGRRPIRSADH